MANLRCGQMPKEVCAGTMQDANSPPQINGLCLIHEHVAKTKEILLAQHLCEKIRHVDFCVDMDGSQNVFISKCTCPFPSMCLSLVLHATSLTKTSDVELPIRCFCRSISCGKSKHILLIKCKRVRMSHVRFQDPKIKPQHAQPSAPGTEFFKKSKK